MVLEFSTPTHNQDCNFGTMSACVDHVRVVNGYRPLPRGGAACEYVFQHVIWFMGRTWHVLQTCISHFPHFSGFWKCHLRNHHEILHKEVQSLVMGIFRRVKTILRHRSRWARPMAVRISSRLITDVDHTYRMALSSIRVIR